MKIFYGKKKNLEKGHTWMLRDEREGEKGFIFFWTPLGKSPGVGDGDRIIAKAFLGL